MIGVVYVLAAAVVATLAMSAYLIVKLVGAKDAELAGGHAAAELERALSAKTVEADRAEFERDLVNKAFAAEHARSAALEAYVTSIEQSDQNVDLAPGDVAGRLRRLLSRQASEAGAAGDPVRSDGIPAVRTDSPAEVHHGAGIDDLLKPE